MATLLFLLKRFFAQRLLGLAIVVTLGFTIGVLVAGPIYADAAREAILSSAIRTASGDREERAVPHVRQPRVRLRARRRGRAGRGLHAPGRRARPPGRGTVRLAGGTIPEPLSLTVLFRDGADRASAASAASRRRARARSRFPRGSRGCSASSSARPVTAHRPDGRGGRAHARRAVRPARSRRPVLVRRPDSVPAPGLDRAAAGADGPGRVPGGRARARGDERVRVGRLPRPGRACRSSAPNGSRQQIERIAERAPRDARVRAAPGRPPVSTRCIDARRQRVADLRVPIFLVVFQIGAVTLAILAGVGSLVLYPSVVRARGPAQPRVLRRQADRRAGVPGRCSPRSSRTRSACCSAWAWPRSASNANGPSLPGVLFPIGLSPFALVLGAIGAAVGAVTLLLLSLPHVRRTILEERRLLSREDRPLISRACRSSCSCCRVALFTFVELRGTRGAVDERARSARSAGAPDADAADLRALVPVAASPAVGAPPSRPPGRRGPRA